MIESSGSKDAGRAELILAVLLGVFAVVVFIDTLTMRTTSLNVGVLGPRVVPFVVAAGLFVSAVLLGIDVLRGGRGEQEEGEDVDLRGGIDWRTLFGLIVLVALCAFLIDIAGFPIASALLFYGASLLLGSRRYILAAVIAIGLSLAAFYGLVLGLGVPLPAGILKGIL